MIRNSGLDGEYMVDPQQNQHVRSKLEAELEDRRACFVQRNTIIIQELRD